MDVNVRNQPAPERFMQLKPSAWQDERIQVLAYRGAAYSRGGFSVHSTLAARSLNVRATAYGPR